MVKLEGNIGRQLTHAEFLSMKRADNADNRVERLFDRFNHGGDLNGGEMSKILHLLPQPQKDSLWQQINQEVGKFWGERWLEFRSGVTKDGEPIPPNEPNFYHVVGILPVMDQFADFAVGEEGKPRDTRTVVVDLMGGTGPIAPKIAQRANPAGYILVDGNPHVEKVAKQNLAKLEIPFSHVIIHDLSEGLPSGVSEAVSEIKWFGGDIPIEVVFISNWGITYLPRDHFLTLMEQCFDNRFNAGFKTRVAFNMLTDGKFDPHVMNQHFGREVAAPLALRGNFSALKKARAARHHSVQFAEELKNVVPIWYPDEIIDPLKQNGFQVGAVNSSLLWGQSTAIKVIRKN